MITAATQKTEQKLVLTVWLLFKVAEVDLKISRVDL